MLKIKIKKTEKRTEIACNVEFLGMTNNKQL